MPIKLYDGQRSPNARKVRLLAAELAEPLELVRLDFAKGEYQSPEFLAKNPNGKVPLLDDDGFLLWESGAILRYLAAKHPEKGLVPNDPKERATLDQWLFWWTAHPEAALWQLAHEKLIKPFRGLPANDPSIVAMAEADLARYLGVLERRLEGREYLLESLSLFEFMVAPWLEASTRLGVDASAYPHIKGWLERLSTRPYWKDA